MRPANESRQTAALELFPQLPPPSALRPDSTPGIGLEDRFTRLGHKEVAFRPLAAAHTVASGLFEFGSSYFNAAAIPGPLIDPHPVASSQPGAAGEPSLPVVMSLNAFL